MPKIEGVLYIRENTAGMPAGNPAPSPARGTTDAPSSVSIRYRDIEFNELRS